MLFEQLHLPEPSMWHYIFIIINYIEFQAAQNSSSPQYMYRIFYHLKYTSLFITIITMKTVVPWSCVTGVTIEQKSVIL